MGPVTSPPPSPPHLTSPPPSPKSPPPAPLLPPPPPPHATLDNESPLTVCNRFLVTFILSLFLSLILLSPHPWYTLLFTLLALLPIFPLYRFISTSLHDPAVSRRFLVSQLVIAAVPLMLIAAQIEWLLSGLIGFAIFASDYDRVANALDTVQPPDLDSDVDSTSSIITALADILPLWKVILFFTVTSFLVAGVVEEVGKWVVGRRYRHIEPQLAADEEAAVPNVGCRGILASFCMTALGFAATENVLYTLGVVHANRGSFSFEAAGLVLLRGILAYPVHVGTTFYVGVAVARRYAFGDGVHVGLALMVAIVLHGVFDAVGFLVLILVTVGKMPKWIGGGVPLFDLMLIGLMLLLCRGRYKALLERERVVRGIAQEMHI